MSRWLITSGKTKNIMLMDTDNPNWQQYKGHIYPYEKIVNHFNKETKIENIEDLQENPGYIKIQTKNSEYIFKYVDDDITSRFNNEKDLNSKFENLHKDIRNLLESDDYNKEKAEEYLDELENLKPNLDNKVSFIVDYDMKELRKYITLRSPRNMGHGIEN